MRRIDRLTRRGQSSERMSLDGLAEALKFQGHAYALGLAPQTTWAPEHSEPITADYGGMAAAGYGGNGPVFACIGARMRLFTEARFKFRAFNNGRPGDLYGTPALALLEQPWRNGTTGDLLARMELHDSLAGNFFATTLGAGADKRIVPLRPDWVALVFDRDPDDPDAVTIGITYKQGGAAGKVKPRFFPSGTYIHYAPTPDPLAQFRGMSWLTPVVREIQADTAATRHKGKFFDNAATPNMAVSLSEKVSVDAFKQFVEIMEDRGAGGGIEQAYKTLYLAGGADVTVIGSDLKQLDFKVTQGAGETRIAAAAGVPPIVVGLSEGLSAATYSNYGQAMRAFGDLWGASHWRNAAASLSPLVAVPQGSELWYDSRDIAALRVDRKDAADIAAVRGQTIRTLVDAGYTPDSVKAAVAADDFNLLVHSGLYSVQLQAPGAMAPAPAA